MIIFQAALSSCSQVEKNEEIPMDESSLKQEAWMTVHQLNRLWTAEGKVEELNNYFHRDMVVISPAARERLVGRDICVAAWKRFVDKVNIINFEELDPDIRIFGEGKVAVVTYYYNITYKTNGRIATSKGRDMFILVKENGRWWAVADQFSPFPEITQE
jgi:ketosteroid isomerase-like protein